MATAIIAARSWSVRTRQGPSSPGPCWSACSTAGGALAGYVAAVQHPAIELLESGRLVERVGTRRARCVHPELGIDHTCVAQALHTGKQHRAPQADPAVTTPRAEQ